METTIFQHGACGEMIGCEKMIGRGDVIQRINKLCDLKHVM